MKHHLVLMSKAPRMGRVKTRLAKVIGFVRAWNFHRRNLFQTAHRLNRPGWTCSISVSPDSSRFQPRQWPKYWSLIAQGSGDLGARMLKPLHDLPHGPVVIIGSDIPNIQPSTIQAAFTALNNHDFVFGPAPDGGFWLVGARRLPKVVDPFQNVRWSTEHALKDTLANLPKGAKVAFVKEMKDVDEASDLKVFF
ncbi:MAG: hypothetical protein COB46_04660 [Rhodospirillaceae bacterium]|nr:MAG: hypothetical protein COB46_04660 [Rhodospirillaceae bacterium]